MRKRLGRLVGMAMGAAWDGRSTEDRVLQSIEAETATRTHDELRIAKTGQASLRPWRVLAGSTGVYRPRCTRMEDREIRYQAIRTCILVTPSASSPQWAENSPSISIVVRNYSVRGSVNCRVGPAEISIERARAACETPEDEDFSGVAAALRTKIVSLFEAVRGSRGAPIALPDASSDVDESTIHL